MFTQQAGLAPLFTQHFAKLTQLHGGTSLPPCPEFPEVCYIVVDMQSHLCEYVDPIYENVLYEELDEYEECISS